MVVFVSLRHRRQKIKPQYAKQTNFSLLYLDSFRCEIMGYRLDIIALLPILLTTGVVLTVPVYNVTINGAWSEWKNITLCYAKSCNISCRINQGHCEKGEMEQIRFCNNPYPGYGGSWCHGPVLRKVDCENHVRPGWSEWGPVKCDKDCKSSDNDTVQGSRRRTCTNPPPIYKNDICCGLGIETQDDNSTICKDLPKCIYTTVSTTAATSTTKVTKRLLGIAIATLAFVVMCVCRTTAGFEYGDADQPKVPIKKDDDNSYDYSECS